MIHLTDDDTLQIGAHAAALTPTEARAMRFLLARSGQVVRRETLENEVWGFAPGVRSEAVPVALRGLRGKLGPHAELLVTLRGIGWRLEQPRPSPSVPTYLSPFHPRPALTTALRESLRSDWRLITVTGPPGSGKSRLVAELAVAEGLHWVDSPPADQQGLRRRIAETTGRLEGLAPSPDVWVVLDGLRDGSSTLGPLLADAPGLRIVVTSNRTCGLLGERVIRVDGLPTDDAIAFLRHRVERPVESSTLAMLVPAVDGLPHALELACRHPGGPRALIHDLQSQRPSSPHPLAALAGPALSAVTPDERLVLEALTVAGTPLSAALLSDWLGEEAPATLQRLVRASMVVPVGHAWRPYAVFTSIVAASLPMQLQEDFDAWLVGQGEDLARRLDATPRAAVSDWTLLLPAFRRALARLDLPEVESICRCCSRFYAVHGPRASQQADLELALHRFPGSLWLQLLSAPATRDVRALSLAESSEDPQLQLWAVRVGQLMGPTRCSDAYLLSLETRLEGADALFVRARRLRLAMLRTGDPASLLDLEALVEAVRPFPLLRAQELIGLSIALHQQARTSRARRAIDAGLTACRDNNIPLATLLARRIDAILTAHAPPHSIDALVEVAADLDQAGMPRQAAESRTYASLVALATGRWSLAEAVRDDPPGGLPSMIAMGTWIGHALAARAGDPSALQALCSVEASAFTAHGEEPRFSVFFAAYLRLLGRVWTGRQSVDDAQNDPALALRSDSTPEARLLVGTLAAVDTPSG